MNAPARGRSAGLLSLFRLECAKILGSRRFQGLSALFVLVLTWSSVLALERYRDERTEVRQGRKLHREQSAGISIDQLASTWFPAWKTPWPLSFVVDGGQVSAPNFYRQQLTAWEVPHLERRLERNSRLPGVLSLDWMFALSSILFLACCLELYDSIGGERLSGSLRVTFSYPLPRWRYLAAKLLSGWCCFSLPLLAGIAGSLAVSLGGEPEIATPQNLGKVAGVTLLCLWGILFFVSLSLLASLSARDPANSLVALLILWVSWVVVVPALAVVGAQQLLPLPGGVEVAQRISQQARGLGSGTAWRERETAWRDRFTWERSSAFRQNRTFSLQEDVRRDVLLAKIRQAQKADDLAAVFSPPALIQALAVRFTGTGFLRDEAFLRQAWNHRKRLEARLEVLDARDPDSPHLLYFTGYLSKATLPPGSLPELELEERTIEEGLRASSIGLAGLALETLLLLGLTFGRFARYDLGELG